MGQRNFSASGAGHSLGRDHALKVDTRVRTPLGLQAKAQVKPPVQSERRVSLAVRPGFVPRTNATRHGLAEDGSGSCGIAQARIGRHDPDLDGAMCGTHLARNDSLYSSYDLFTAVPTPGSSSHVPPSPLRADPTRPEG